MIQANELRIGDLIYSAYTNLVCGAQPVTFIKKEGNEFLIAVDGSIAVTEDNISGVPLTEEILLKSGFIIKPGSGETSYQNVHTNIFELDRIYNDDAYFLVWDGAYVGINIDFVHQLQNAFFVLTGKELEIKL